MTRTDQQILFTALAYIAVYLKPSEEPHLAEPANVLARHIEEYCRNNLRNAFPPVSINFVNDYDAAIIDTEIDKHIKALRDEGSTVLPQDKETLIKFYDRLQQRKSRRTQSVFYETVKTGTLADTVLSYLDEEIDDAEAKE